MMNHQQAEWGWDSVYLAPAKLNLFLHIVGRRPDGYHLLQSVFRFVDYGDHLSFSPREDALVRLATPIPGVNEEDDLTVRAARLLQQETGCQRGVTIQLEKRLPMGGGLGGGSSDAATVLIALNYLWQLNLSRQRLMEIGLTLGADVPVFIFGETAFAEGVGEQLRAIEANEAYYVVLEPPVQVPTVEIFRSSKLKRDTAPIDPQCWAPNFGHNDMQPVAVDLYPVIGDYLSWLNQYAEARMTGSGACVFAEFETRLAAARVMNVLPTSMRGFLARGLSLHPLRALVVNEPTLYE